MRKIAFIAGAVALAAAIAAMSQTAAFRSQSPTAAVAGTVGPTAQTVKPAEANTISPFELMKNSKNLPVEDWRDPF